MAATFTAVQGPNGPYVTFGGLLGRLYKVTGDGSYPNTGTDATSGYNCSGQIALSKILYGQPNPSSANATSVVAQFRTDTNRIRLFYPTGGVAPASISTPTVIPGNATNNSNNSTLGGNNATLNAGNMTELANATNVSSLSYTFLFLGY